MISIPKNFALGVAVAFGLGFLVHWGISERFASAAVSPERPTAAASAPCTSSDFAISGLSAQRSWEYATVRGTIRSSCASAARVILRWTATYADGSTSNFTFPATGGPIEPNGQYLFQHTEILPPGQPKYQMTVDQVG